MAAAHQAALWTACHEVRFFRFIDLIEPDLWTGRSKLCESCDLSHVDIRFQAHTKM